MAAPPIPARIYPTNNALVTSLPTTFRTTCADTPDNVYFVSVTALGKILTVANMPLVSGEYRLAVQAPGTSHKLTFTWSGTPASGYAIISLFGNAVTVPWNASATEIQALLEGLPDLNVGDVLVTGRPVDVGGVTITMRNNRAGLSYLMDDQLGWWSTSALKNSSGTTLTTTRTIVTQGTGHIPNVGGGFGDWYWYAVSRKGGVFCGDTTRFCFADRSAKWRWWYSAAPVVTVTTPTVAQVVTGSSPTVAWTVSLTNSSPLVYQEITYVDDATGAPVYFWATDPARPDGTTVTPAGSGRRVISGDETTRSFKIPIRILRNSRAYHANVMVVNEAGQTSTVSRGFSIAFTPPAAVATFTGSPSVTGSYTDFAWSISAASGFAGYDLRWRYATATWDGTEETIWSTDTQATVTRRAFEYPLGKAIVFGLFVRTVVSGENLISAAKEWTPPSGKLGLYGMSVISQVAETNRTYIVLMARRERDVKRIFSRPTRERWGRSKPVIYRDQVLYHVVSCTYVLMWSDATIGNEEDIIANAETLVGQSLPCLYRDYRGRMFYGAITNLDELDSEDYLYSEVPIEFTEGDVEVGS